tara:strand:- start:5696 stop:6019 length:324 start_codon:yes stop_codon:yes gene_type:complete
MNKFLDKDILKINLKDYPCFKRPMIKNKLITNQLLYQLSYRGSKKKLIYKAKMNFNRFVLALFLCPKSEFYKKIKGNRYKLDKSQVIFPKYLSQLIKNWLKISQMIY